jgi:hypothetical protein
MALTLRATKKPFWKRHGQSSESVQSRASEALLRRRRREPWTPFPGPQKEAYESEADVIGYGGAGGGGKTDLQLGFAITKHQRAIIFRREYPQLAGIEDRSREILRGIADYNAQKKRWAVPAAPGRAAAQIQFGAMQYEEDKEKWRGIPHDFKGYDEAQNLTRTQVEFCLAWLRTNKAGQRCRALITFNPPTSAEGEWLIDYFAPWLNPKHPRPAYPGELRWYAMIAGEDTEVDGPEPIAVDEDGQRVEVSGKPTAETILPKSRTFFPARVEDNPVYMESGYKAQLQSLPEPLRSQMLKGDFTVGRIDDAWQVIPSAWVKAAFDRWTKDRPTTEDGELLPLSALGADIACGGADRTVLAPRYGEWFAPLVVRPGRETPRGEDAARLIIETMGDDLNRVAPNVDIIGVGQGARTALNMAGVRINEVVASEGTSARDRSGLLKMANVRSEMWWMFREALDPASGYQIALPPDRELLNELTAPRWSLEAEGDHGEIRIERSELVNKRVGRSLDKAVAVLLAWYQAQTAGTMKNPWRR